MRLRLAGIVAWLALLLTSILAAGNTSVEAAGLNFLPHLAGGGYYRIVSDQGETLAMMALPVSPGDYLITEDNRGWTVTSIKGRVARAKFDHWVDLTATVDRAPWGERLTTWLGSAAAAVRDAVGVKSAKPGAGMIAIYHTHSDESYVPSMGKASLPTGDIYKVGTNLADALRGHGFTVDQSFNNHNPHDGAAYHRSRRTVMELMQKRPIAMFDVHRDAIPDPNYYRKQVAGETIAQVRLVVGKQNQNRAVNFDFAKRLMAEANRIHPGLVKEIFWAKGNYNQDLSSKAMLFEFGTHTNSERMADRGAKLLADAIPVVLTGQRTAPLTTKPHRQVGGTAAGSRANPGANTPRGRLTRAQGAQSRTAGTTALWIAVLVIGGGLAYLALNAGGASGSIGRQMKKFTGQELSGFLGRRYGRKRTQPDHGEEPQINDRPCERPNGDQGSSNGDGNSDTQS